jgi:ammonium transporter, Amt family
VNQHWIQLGYQFLDALTGSVYSFGMSCAILFLIESVPGLHLRASQQAEILGIDDTEIGEFAVSHARPCNVSFLQLTPSTV